MTRTVDLVIAGEACVPPRVAVDALRRGQRVLVVLHSDDRCVARRLRSTLRRAVGKRGGRLRIMTGTEVVCVDGVESVEAVVVRHVRTGRLCAVNASRFLDTAAPNVSAPSHSCSGRA